MSGGEQRNHLPESKGIELQPGLRPSTLSNKNPVSRQERGHIPDRPGSAHTSTVLSCASLLVAATSPQPSQERRKLEIRSSSHKSLQSPKGPRNTSKRFPLTRISAMTWQSQQCAHISNRYGAGQTHSWQECMSGAGPGAYFFRLP